MKLCLGCVWLALVLAAAPPAGEEISPETQLLARVFERAQGNLARLPNYTCLQTIERSLRLSNARSFRPLDRVRLEVALVDGRELFAWPGEGKFQDKQIGDIVSGGAIGNGDFALHAKSVFESRAVSGFSYAGERIREGRRTLRWDFRVPQFQSGYTIKVGERKAIVGYRGSFWVDAGTLDLIRLEVQADDIPAELQLLAAGNAVEYERVAIGDTTFLLPRLSELTMTDFRGTANRNQTTFSACRQYKGESVILFTDPSDAATAAKPETRDFELPADVTLVAALESRVEAASAAVGDPITAVLKQAVKLDGRVIAPKGARLRGRLTMLRLREAQPPSYVIGLQFHDLVFTGARAKVNAELQQLMTASGSVATSPRGWPSWKPFPLRELTNSTVAGSVLFARPGKVLLDRGLTMVWRTVAVDER
ncbi:MAG: hypothetical protein HYZ57_04995 [Acidobacteria bacterium]|nr:hypothetical protein [Acidobacteriota bacterium]